MITETVYKSRFTDTYFDRLKEWASEIINCPGVIIAISRKGPRLLELLIRENIGTGSGLSS